MTKQEALSDYSFIQIVHYTRLMLVLVAASLTMTTSIVLLDTIYWNAVLIVALSTYAVYSIDNLVDWQKEKHLLAHLEALWRIYLPVTRLLVAIALIIMSISIIQQGLDFILLISTLTMVSVLIMWLSRFTRIFNQSLYYWAERLIVAISWALTTTLVPIFYAKAPITPQVLMTIIFVWQISWAVGVIWRYTSIISVRKTTPEIIAREGKLINLLKFACVTAAIQAIIDILLGYFPFYNAIVLVAPVIIFVFLLNWQQAYKNSLLYSFLFFSGIFVGTLMIIGVYTIILAQQLV